MLLWSREQFPLDVAFAISLFNTKDVEVEAALIDVESLASDAYGQRQQRGLLYSAVGNMIDNFDRLRGIRGMFEGRELLSYKVQPCDKAITEDNKARLSCVLSNSIRPRPPPAPVMGAGGLSAGSLETTNSLLKSLVGMMATNLEFTKKIEQKVGFY